MEKMKISKYSYSITDEHGDIIIYNFLSGLSSVRIIRKKDVNEFEKTIINLQENGITSEKNKIEKDLCDTGYMVPSDIDELVEVEAKRYEAVFNRNLEVMILPTGECNFACPYCFEKSKPVTKHVMNMDEENRIIKFVEKQIHSFTGLHVTWFGGEPLLRMDAITRLSQAFIQICDAKRVPYSAGMITNGYFLDSGTFQKLYDLKTYSFMITLDGLKEQHDKSRIAKNNNGSFDTIVKNLLYIRDDKKYKFVKIRIRINMTKENTEILGELISYLNHTFDYDRRFSFQFIPVADFENSQFGENSFSDIDAIAPILQGNKIYLDKLQPLEEKLDYLNPIKMCFANLKNSFVFLPDLKVGKCNLHYDIKENQIGYLDEGGNIIYNNAFYQKWFLPDSTMHNLPNRCKACFYLPCCHASGKICPVRKMYEKPEDRKCFLKEQGFVENLEKNIRLWADLSTRKTSYLRIDE